MLLPYLFDATLNFSSSPFGLELPSSVVFFTQPGVCSSSKARCRLPSPKLSNFHQLPLPFRTFILPDRSAQSAAGSEKLAFVSGPFSLRSPQALINFVNYPLTDHRFRFATVYQLSPRSNFQSASDSSPRPGRNENSDFDFPLHLLLNRRRAFRLLAVTASSTEAVDAISALHRSLHLLPGFRSGAQFPRRFRSRSRPRTESPTSIECFHSSQAGDVTSSFLQLSRLRPKPPTRLLNSAGCCLSR